MSLRIRIADGDLVIDPSDPIEVSLDEDVGQIYLDATESQISLPDRPEFSWTITDSGGLANLDEALSDSEYARARFLVPGVFEDTTVQITLTVTSGPVSATAPIHLTILNSINNPPELTVESSVSRAVAGDVVTLEVTSAVDPNGDELDLPFTWRQTAPPNTLDIELSDASNDLSYRKARFTAPEVTFVTEVTFEVSIRDIHPTPAEGRAEITITLAPGGDDTCESDDDCQDDNPCTTGHCNDRAQCEAIPVTDGTACDDGDACTTDTECLNGLCAGGILVVCDDGNPCTENHCDPETGCIFPPLDGVPCDDGDACTTGNVCDDGECIATGTRECNDGNPCTENSCDPSVGCVFTPFAEGAECDDGNACTTDAQCASGQCIATTRVNCDDGNPCTRNYCDPTEGCRTENLDIPCDDGDACTVGDHCQLGECVSGEARVCDDGNPCTTNACDSEVGCVFTAHNDPCDDGNACTEGSSCAGGVCHGGQPIECDDGNPCTTNSCDPSTGCTAVHRPGTCDDGNPCTIGGRCHAGACMPEDQRHCDDGNPCTVNSCDPEVGCVDTWLADGTACSDGDPCTENGLCLSGVCVGEPAAELCSCEQDIDCAALDLIDRCAGEYYCNPEGWCELDRDTAVECVQPANSCLESVCDPETGLCEERELPNETPCGLDDRCVVGAACINGQCVGGTARDCDDGNPCTNTDCYPDEGCVAYFTGPIVCDNNNPCTENDRCRLGVCEPGEPVDCDDGDPCTTGYCNAKEGGCVQIPNTLDCDNGDACTIGDFCRDGTCIAGAAVQCDDGNPCTENLCRSNEGCVFIPRPGSFCDDGNACTKNTSCNQDGRCVGGAHITCDDDNPCTANRCDPAVGCVFPARTDGTPCSDGDPCSVGDTCQSGACVGGSAAICDDGDQCTEGICVEGVGCTFQFVSGRACDDGDPCTTDTVCTGGKCQGVFTPELCACESDQDCDDDGNPCTGEVFCDLSGEEGFCRVREETIVECDGEADTFCRHNTCDPTDGQCKMTPRNNGTFCESENACAAFAVCEGGECVPQILVDCDDGNPCTDNSCDPVEGCQKALIADGAPCDDRNPCTLTSSCMGGICQGDEWLECDDSNPCTANVCDPFAAEHCVTKPLTSVPCDDGDPCTVQDTCFEGECIGRPLDCDDGNPCTDNHCDAAGDCVAVFNSAPCAEGYFCRTDGVCVEGECQWQEVDCEHENPCLTGICYEAHRGCVYTAEPDCCGGDDDCVGDDPCEIGSCDLATNTCHFEPAQFGHPCAPPAGPTYLAGMCDAARRCIPVVRSLYPVEPDSVWEDFTILAVDHTHAVGRAQADPGTGGPSQGVILSLLGPRLYEMVYTSQAAGEYLGTHEGRTVGSAGMARLEDGAWREFGYDELGLTPELWTNFTAVAGGFIGPIGEYDDWVLPTDGDGIYTCMEGPEGWVCFQKEQEDVPAVGHVGDAAWTFNYPDDYGAHGDVIFNWETFVLMSGDTPAIAYTAHHTDGPTPWVTDDLGCADGASPACSGPIYWNDIHGHMAWLADGRELTLMAVGEAGHVAYLQTTLANPTPTWQKLDVPTEELVGVAPPHVSWRGVAVFEHHGFLLGAVESCLRPPCKEGLEYRAAFVLHYDLRLDDFSAPMVLDQTVCPSDDGHSCNAAGYPFENFEVHDMWGEAVGSDHFDLWIGGGWPAYQGENAADNRALLYHLRLRMRH